MALYEAGKGATQDRGTTVVLQNPDDNLSVKVLQAYDSNGLTFKASDGTTSLVLSDTGDMTVDGSLALTDVDVAHGVTNVTQTSAFGDIGPIHGTRGGLMINGLSDQESTDARSLALRGICNDAHTDTVPTVELIGAKRSGATVQALDATETVLEIANHTTKLMTVLGSGNLGVGTATPTALLHTQDGAIKFEDSSNLLVDFESGDSTILKFVNEGVSESTSFRTNRSFKFDTGDTVNNALVISAAGNIDIAGDLTVKGHDIKAQDGTLCMTLNDATGDRAGYVDFAASVRLSEDGYIGTPNDAILVKLNGGSNQVEITGNLVVGDGTETDQLLALNGNAQDFRVGIDDGTDTMEIGQGVVMGTNTAISINSSGQVAAFNIPDATIAQASDHIIFLDGGATGAPKAESVGDFLTAIAGAGISVSSSQLTAAGGGDTAEMVVQSDAASSVGSPLAPGADTVVILCVTSIAARYIQLPAAATATADRRYYIKDKAGNASNFNINILTNLSEEIDGSSANLVISTNYASVHLITDGSNWYII